MPDADHKREFVDFDATNLPKRRHADQHALDESGIHDPRHGRYIGDLVYGALDGIVTTFAIISGVAGASLSSGVVLILGFANLFADGLSMAVGNYLGAKSRRDYHARERRRENWEIDNIPMAERQEIRDIYARKGFTGELLEQVVTVITGDRKLWVDTMMLEELHIIPDIHVFPIRSALVTFWAFAIAGFVPLISYVAAYMVPSLAVYSYPVAIGMTVLALFVVGSLRVYVTGKRWWKSGLEMLLVGGAAAIVAYLIGYSLRGLA